MMTLDDIIVALGPYAERGAAPALPVDIAAIVLIAREVKQLRETLMARQDPIEIPNEAGTMVRRWRAWGICTLAGQLAEVTLDLEKANVWLSGGHKVICFVHEEPMETVDG